LLRLLIFLKKGKIEKMNRKEKEKKKRGKRREKGSYGQP